MKNSIILFTVLLISIVLFSACQEKNVKSEKNNTSQSIKSGSDIIASKEFKEYFDVFFKLSDSNTKTTLPYVNKYMKDNKLIPFTDLCKLLDNDKIKADSIVFNHWKRRCRFQNARNALKEKFNIESDSIQALIQEAVLDRD